MSGRGGVRALQLLFVVLASVLLAACGSGGSEKESKESKIKLGERVEVMTASVSTDGGSITVDEPGSPIDGLVLEVPKDSFGGETSFKISYRPIDKHELGPGITAVTPLITVDNGGQYSEEFMTLKLPASVPEGRFAMGFRYDESSGALEGVTTLDEDSTSLTLLTRHFSDFAGFSMSKADLDVLNKDTGFTRGADDWNLKNMGSFIAPGGYCQGMCLSAIWHYKVEKPISGEPLWSQNVSGPGVGGETPEFWEDDSAAIKLCSMVQENLAVYWGKAYQAVSDHFERRARAAEQQTGQKPANRNRVQFYSFALAIAATGQPQLMNASNPNVKTSHTVIVYKVSNRKLYVADPNVPGKAAPLGDDIYYEDSGGPNGDGKFGTYTSAQNFLDLLSSRYVTYSDFAFLGATELVRDKVLARYWQDFKSGTIGAQAYYDEELHKWKESYELPVFEEYVIVLSELDERGNITDEYELDRIGGTTVGTESVMLDIEWRVDSPISGELDDLKVYRLEDVLAYERAGGEGAFPEPEVVNLIKLQPGDNILGLSASGAEGGLADHGWLGFDWVNIRYEPEQETPTASPTGEASPTASASATAEVSPTGAATTMAGGPTFTEEDCACAPSGLTVFNQEPSVNKRALRCDYHYADDRYGLTFEIEHSSRYPSGGYSLLQEHFTTTRESFLAGEDPRRHVLEDSDTRFTVVTKAPIGRTDAFNFVGARAIVLPESWYLYIWVSNVFGNEDQWLEVVDAMERCAMELVEQKGGY